MIERILFFSAKEFGGQAGCSFVFNKETDPSFTFGEQAGCSFVSNKEVNSAHTG
jgi:hypothetical protein